MNKPIELIYVMDPHCGWCFGFGKVILELFETYKNNPSLSFDVIPGGLFYPPIQIHDGFAEDKRPIAKRIEELTGLKFSESYFTKVLGNGSFLDSEVPARAILCVRKMSRELLIPFTEKLLEKEFVLAKNNSLEETVFEAVNELSIEVTEFEKLFSSDEMKQKVLKQFQQAGNMVAGYPVLFMKDGSQFTKLASGYAPYERLTKKIETMMPWIAD